MISPIQLTPNMTPDQMATAINNTLRQIEAENRTKIVKDEDGTNRIIFGRLPNGEYGIVISKKGKDVLEYKDFV